MSIKAQIIDGYGTGNKAKINGEGEFSVVVHPHPPIDEEIEALPFRQYFTDNGAASGSNDMTVNGATTNVDFYISAVAEYDIYIKYISAEIGDGGTPSLNKFGALTALTNGVGFYWFTQKEAEYELHEGIKTNKEFIRVGTDTGAIGTGVDAYLADVSGGGTEKSYFPQLDIAESYGLPWGVRLTKGTTDKLIFRVADNLTGLTTFNIVAYGIRL
jgi:hypothetical protein